MSAVRAVNANGVYRLSLVIEALEYRLVRTTGYASHCCHTRHKPIGQQFGQSGQWSSVPPTAAMGRSAVVDLEVGSNDGLALRATSGFDPIRSFASRMVQRQVSKLSGHSYPSGQRQVIGLNEHPRRASGASTHLRIAVVRSSLVKNSGRELERRHIKTCQSSIP